jgi:tRNA(fMet)-specific endonuclease VapC
LERHLDVLDWDTGAAHHYGAVRAKLDAAGTPIGAMDMMIAAHAKSVKAVLVTNNQKHFTKVKGLRTDNWV